MSGLKPTDACIMHNIVKDAYEAEFEVYRILTEFRLGNAIFCGSFFGWTSINEGAVCFKYSARQSRSVDARHKDSSKSVVELA